MFAMVIFCLGCISTVFLVLPKVILKNASGAARNDSGSPIGPLRQYEIDSRNEALLTLILFVASIAAKLIGW